MKFPTRFAVLKLPVSFLIGAAVLPAFSGVALAQPRSGSVTSYSYGGTGAIAGEFYPAPWGESSTQTESWNGVPSMLTANSSVSEPSSQFLNTYTVSDSIYANWSPSGDSGAIQIDDSYDLIVSPGLFSYTYFAQTSWSYTFTAEATGQVDFNYQNSNPAEGEVLLFNLTGPFTPSGIELFQDSAESFTGSVIAGNTYTLDVQDALIISTDTTNQGPQEYTSDFSFSLPSSTSAVPDSSATLTLLSGVVAGLAALRRRIAR